MPSPVIAKERAGNASTSRPPIRKKHITTNPAGAVTIPAHVGVKF